MRLFVGVPLPADVREKLWAFWGVHGKKLENTRSVAPENYHITLKFIGEVSEERAKNIANVLESAVPETRFKIRVAGIGGFPASSKAKVIWAGVLEGSQELTALGEYIDRLLGSQGVPKETKAFHPHVTLARVKRGVADVTSLARQRPEFGTFEFQGFTLYQSTLTPEGPIYKSVRDYEVGR